MVGIEVKRCQHSMVRVPAADVLVSGSADNSARIWNLETCECSHVLEGHTDAVNEVVIKVSPGYKDIWGVDDVTQLAVSFSGRMDVL